MQIYVPFFWIACVFFPILCIGLDQREFPEFGLGWEEFVSCFKSLFLFTLIATFILLLIGFYFDSIQYDGQFPTRFSEYVFWAFLQQIGLQIFFTRRMQNIFKSPVVVSLITATVFAFIHFPNPALVLLTWVGGFFWCFSFQRTPNLYALAISHAWLAVMTLYCVPPYWLHQLRIGPDYWTYIQPLLP